MDLHPPEEIHTTLGISAAEPFATPPSCWDGRRMGCSGNSRSLRDNCATEKHVLVLTQESRTGETCEEWILGPHRGALPSAVQILFPGHKSRGSLHPPASVLHPAMTCIPTQPLPSAAPGIFQQGCVSPGVPLLPGCQHLRSRSQILPTGPAWQLPAAPPPTHSHQLLLGSAATAGIFPCSSSPGSQRLIPPCQSQPSLAGMGLWQLSWAWICFLLPGWEHPIPKPSGMGLLPRSHTRIFPKETLSCLS